VFDGSHCPDLVFLLFGVDYGEFSAFCLASSLRFFPTLLLLRYVIHGFTGDDGDDGDNGGDGDDGGDGYDGRW